MRRFDFQVLAVMGMSAVFACTSREFNADESNTISREVKSVSASDGATDIEFGWSCAGSRLAATEYGHGNGIRQNEYCEWDRALPANNRLQCAFRTTFDSSRKLFLNMRGRSSAARSLDTLANTYTAFAGNSEPPKAGLGEKGGSNGLFGACMVANARCQSCQDVKSELARQACLKGQFPFVACDASRQSDVTICRSVQNSLWTKVCDDGEPAEEDGCDEYRCAGDEPAGRECLQYELDMRYKVIGLRYSRIFSAGARVEPQLFSPLYKSLPAEARMDIQKQSMQPSLKSHYVEGAAIPTGDTRFKLELRFPERLAKNCKYAIDANLQANASVLRTAAAAKKARVIEPGSEAERQSDRFADEDAFLLPDKTLVLCDFNKASATDPMPSSCDDLAREMNVVVKAFVSNGVRRKLSEGSQTPRAGSFSANY